MVYYEQRQHDFMIFYSLSAREIEKNYENVACRSRVNAFAQTHRTSLRSSVASLSFSNVNDFQK
jgi:hypothetical protein